MTRRLEVNPRHQVSDVDPITRMGICSHCGPVKAYKAGIYRDTQNWRCGAVALAYANARVADPEVDRANRNARFIRLYGITLDDYERMAQEQDGKCARCQESLDEGPLRLAVDHCHKTGTVRKLLCGPCNTYLGRLEANRDRLISDLDYLDNGHFAAPLASRL